MEYKDESSSPKMEDAKSRSWMTMLESPHVCSSTTTMLCAPTVAHNLLLDELEVGEPLVDVVPTMQS
jgi:hypothetical protein